MTKKNVGIRVSFVWYRGKKWFGTKRSRFGIKEKLGVVVVGDDFFQTSLPNNKKRRNKWPWNIMHQQGLSDPMCLGGAKEYFKKAESNL